MPELARRVGWLAAVASAHGASFAGGLCDGFDAAIRRALDLLASDGDLELYGQGDDELVVVPDERRPHLEYYKNNGIHPLAEIAIVARAILLAGAGAGLEVVRERARALSRLLKYELVYRPGAGDHEEAFRGATCLLERLAWIELRQGRVGFTEEGAAALSVVAALVASYLESYRLVVRALIVNPRLRGRDLVHRAAALGERALVLGELARREAISRPAFESGVMLVEETGALEDRATLYALGEELERAVAKPPGPRPRAES